MTAIPHATSASPASRRAAPHLAAARRDALRDILPMLLAVLPFAVVIGVAAADQDLGLGIGLTTSFLLYGGSAYLAVLALLGTGTTFVVAILTAAIVNARLLLYGAAMADRFRDQPAWFRWVGPHFVVDQTYMIASARSELDDPARFRRYWLSAATALTVVWLGGNAIGMMVGPVMPASSPLDVTKVALFIGLLIPRLGDRVARLTAATAAVVTAVSMGLPHGSGLVLAIACGVAASIVATRKGGSA